MILIEDVTIKYESAGETVVAVSEASLSAQVKELVGIVGPSGSGKSTLLAAIGGLVPVDTGRIVVNNVAVHECNAEERAALRLSTIGIVAQDASLFPGLTVVENVAIAAELQGRSRREARSQALAILDQLRIGHLGLRFPAEISGGQRQRTGIARGLIGGRKVLLADEPTAALDTASAMQVVDALKDAAALGAAVVVATHDPRVVAGMQRWVEIKDGCLTVDP